jgi:hypothetical protein
MMIIANSYNGRVHACLKKESPGNLWKHGDTLWGETVLEEEITETVEFETIEDFEAHNFDGTESGRQISFYSAKLREYMGDW